MISLLPTDFLEPDSFHSAGWKEVFFPGDEISLRSIEIPASVYHVSPKRSPEGTLFPLSSARTKLRAFLFFPRHRRVPFFLSLLFVSP